MKNLNFCVLEYSTNGLVPPSSMLSTFLHVVKCKKSMHYIRELWISRGGLQIIENAMGIICIILMEINVNSRTAEVLSRRI